MNKNSWTDTVHDLGRCKAIQNKLSLYVDNHTAL